MKIKFTKLQKSGKRSKKNQDNLQKINESFNYNRIFEL